MRTATRHDELLRGLAPRVLGALARRHGRFDSCEDAVQEALLAASQQWPSDGVPDNPYGWLVTVATRRLTDEIRAQDARRRREETVRGTDPPAQVPDEDDSLAVLLLCCHPSLSPPSQIALTLRAVGGLTTEEIARAFLVPEATMAQRISRAKATIRRAGARFELPAQADAGELHDRMRAVLHVLYLIFNEGYTASAGTGLQRRDLVREAVRLTRMVRATRPEDGEVAGLLALMLLTDARRAARETESGMLVALQDQDRAKWDREEIAEGLALVREALARPRLGPFQVQAAIAAVHAEAPSADVTDWPQIVALYKLLEHLAPSPVVTLNHAVAVSMVHGPRDALALLDGVDLEASHRFHAVRAHLLEQAGDDEQALVAYRTAARMTTSTPEQRYLESRIARLAPPD